MSVLSPARRSAVEPAAPRRPRFRGGMRDLPMAIAFILPATIGFGVFLVWPSIRGIWLSFTDYSVFQPGHFVGLDNYSRMVTDPVFWASMRITVYYVVVNIGVQTVVALVLAVLLSRLTQSMWVRGIVLTPYLVSNVVTALLWLLLLDYQLGIVNELLEWVGIGRQSFWGNPDLVVPTIAMVNVWRHVGYTALLIFAGLQSIPNHVYEVASLDGSSPTRTFWSITMPLLRPVLVLVLVVTVIGSFQVFDTVAVTTAGGPINASRVIQMYIYQKAFSESDFGYASALSVILFLILALVAFVQMKFLKGNESDLD